MNKGEITCSKIAKRNKVRKAKRKLTTAQLEHLNNEGQLWHHRMGHISPQYLQKLRDAVGRVSDLLSTASVTTCTECAQAKQK